MGIPKWPPCPNIMTFMHIHTAHTRAHSTHMHTRVHDTYKVSVFSVYLSVCVYVYMCIFMYIVCVCVCICVYFKNTSYLLVKVAH